MTPCEPVVARSWSGEITYKYNYIDISRASVYNQNRKEIDIDMSIKHFLEDIGCGGLGILTVLQTEQILRIANLILAIIISLLVLVSRIVEWWKKAKADGKIDADEVKEGVKIIEDGAKEIKEHIDNGNK